MSDKPVDKPEDNVVTFSAKAKAKAARSASTLPTEPRPDRPNQNVIEILEGALEDAKAGDLRGIILVGTFDDGATANGLTGRLDPSAWGVLEEMKVLWFTQSRPIITEE